MINQEENQEEKSHMTWEKEEKGPSMLDLVLHR